MQSFGRFSVLPVMPERIRGLHALAYNLWWMWHAEAQQLYSDIDPALWDAVRHNPVRFLSRVQSEPLDRAADDPDYLARYDAVMAELAHYMAADDTWFRQAHPDQDNMVVAYFSPEFGLHESLPIYSGGLGILSGDQCKEASDLGLPFIGVGFLYPQGYFIQRITQDGTQEAIYEKMHFSEVPATPALTPDGQEVFIHVDLPGRRVYAKVWQFQVGRVRLYLMDTDVDLNDPADRDLGAKLYVGDHAMRLAQEVVLGVGGVRTLRALGIHPTVWHMNEGHSAFLGLERIRELVEGAGLSFEEARQVVAADTVFTTHTPVAAGNEAFSFDLMERFFHAYWPSLGVDRDEFLGLGYHEQAWGATFSMTVLALGLSSFANGVSALHGEVSRAMWQELWPGLPMDEVEITHITNGVHTGTWIAPEMDALFQTYLGVDWKRRVDDPALWQGVDAIPDAEFWQVHLDLKRKLVERARQETVRHRERLGEGPRALAEAGHFLDPDALTIGFARRFATYKRATLLMSDLQRLYQLLAQEGRPVQFIFAGKAHPADEPGKALIRAVYRLAATEEFAGRILFLEGYDMEVARYLVQGADVWLNNPTRPREASGTSGEKAALNGILNFSVLDGWWAEGYNGHNGWAIGDGRLYASEELQTEADSVSLYDTLEHKIIPLYYDQTDGVPVGWVKMVKDNLKTLTWQFSAARMMKGYTLELYLPANSYGVAMRSDGYSGAREIVAWQDSLDETWHELSLAVDAPREGQLTVGASVPVTARVRLGSLTPEDVLVEALTWQPNGSSGLPGLQVTPLKMVARDGDVTVYRGELQARTSGSLAYTVRVLPFHPKLGRKHAARRVRWA